MRAKRLIPLITLVIGAVICADPGSSPESSPTSPTAIRFPNRKSIFENFLESSESGLKSEDFPLFSSKNASIRIKRDANDDPFSVLEARISSLSRVVTGVSLYNGLIDGSIPVDQVISELMNIGSISLKDLETFDKTKVDDFIGKLKSASGKLDPNAAILQKQLVDVQAIRVMWSKMGDLPKLPENSKFDGFSALKTMDLKGIEQVAFKNIIKILEDKSDISKAKLSLETLSSVLSTTIASLEKSSILNTLQEMAPFSQFVQLGKYYEASGVRGFRDTEQAELDSFLANWKVLSDLKSDDTNLLASTGISIDKKYTSGFVNGVSDIKKLQTDVDDPWIRSVLKSYDVKDGLVSLVTLANDLTPLNEQLSPVRLAKRANRRVQYFQSKLGAIQGTPSSPQPIIASAKNCPFATVSQQFEQDIGKMSTHSKRLLRKVQLIYSTSKVLSENADSISALDESKPETVDSVLRLAQTMKFDFDELTSGEKIEKLATGVLAGRTAVKDFSQNSDALKYSKTFNCLKELSNDLEVIASTSSLMIEIKEDVKDDFVKEIGLVSSQISSATTHIKTARTSWEGFKSKQKSEKLKPLKDLHKFSKPLGDSATALSMIQKVIEKNVEVLQFLGDGESAFENGVNALATDPILQKKIRSKWDGFEAAKQDLIGMLKGIQSRKSKMTPLNDTDLDALGTVLTGFSGLGDVRLDVENMDSALVLLAEKLTDASLLPLKAKVGNVRDGLMQLDSLDLGFAKFDASLSGMSGTMNGVKKVFSSAPVSSAEESTSEKPKEDNSNIIIIIVCVLGGVLLFILFIVLIIGCIKGWCCCGKKGGKNKNGTGKSGGTTTTGGKKSKDSKTTKSPSATPSASDSALPTPTTGTSAATSSASAPALSAPAGPAPAGTAPPSNAQAPAQGPAPAPPPRPAGPAGSTAPVGADPPAQGPSNGENQNGQDQPVRQNGQQGANGGGNGQRTSRPADSEGPTPSEIIEEVYTPSEQEAEDRYRQDPQQDDTCRREPKVYYTKREKK